uniref:Mucin 5f n=1 Tax=Seriola lalandi dorsalis TaxID=1841481 RepID=A0A3B4XDX1_SERLL
MTDHDGYCFIGYCNATCHVVLIHHKCVPSRKVCVDVSPPRQDGESWKENNCTVATCDDGKVTYNKTQCPTPNPVVCANNFPAIKVRDGDECCPHNECQCVCYGWGDPHYVTFDGTYYDFQGNCSYWLVKEILPKYNFSVMIDNYYCGVVDRFSCPHSITVFYQSYKIFIIQEDINTNFTNQVFVNDRLVTPAYQNADFRLTTTGIDTVLVIPKIHAKVTFSGLIFSIYLPYGMFGGNTEGQCGTCNNNRTDDCRLPDGKIDPSCPNMAHEWHANNSNCARPSEPTPTPMPETCNTTICEIIKSSVFEACHKVIDYNPFVVACEFDVCHMHINHISCTSLQSYADACAEAGVCIDWRSSTKGLCEYTCPSPKVYKACGPQVEPTCELWYSNSPPHCCCSTAMTNLTLEGCYCPKGTTLLSSSSNKCVPTCGKRQHYCMATVVMHLCLTLFAGLLWPSCKECICEEDTLRVTCRNMSCPTLPPLSCDQEGQVKVPETAGCCPKEKCVSVCVCVQGYEYQNVPGQCCGKCVQTSCVVTLQNNSTHTLKVCMCVHAMYLCSARQCKEEIRFYIYC